MHRHADFVLLAGKQQRFVAEHEHRRAAEEVHAHDRRAGGDAANPVGQ